MFFVCSSSFGLRCFGLVLPFVCVAFCVRLCVGLGCVSVCVVVCRFVRVFAGSVVLFLCGLFGLRASLGFVRGCV